MKTGRFLRRDRAWVVVVIKYDKIIAIYYIKQILKKCPKSVKYFNKLSKNTFFLHIGYTRSTVVVLE